MECNDLILSTHYKNMVCYVFLGIGIIRHANFDQEIYGLTCHVI